MYQVTTACVTLPRFYLDRSRTIGRRRFVMEVLAVRKIAMYLSFFVVALFWLRDARRNHRDRMYCQAKIIMFDGQVQVRVLFQTSIKTAFFTTGLTIKKMPHSLASKSLFYASVNFTTVRMDRANEHRYDYQFLRDTYTRTPIEISKLWNTYSVFVLSPYFKSYFANLFRFSDV